MTRVTIRYQGGCGKTVRIKTPAPDGVCCFKFEFSDLITAETKNPYFVIKSGILITAGCDNQDKSGQVRIIPRLLGLGLGF